MERATRCERKMRRVTDEDVGSKVEKGGYTIEMNGVKVQPIDSVQRP